MTIFIMQFYCQDTIVPVSLIIKKFEHLKLND